MKCALLAPAPARAEMLEPRMLLAAAPYISEFMAANDGTLADIDGDWSDWIEITNPSSQSLNLDGYYLTDDPATLSKWRLPAVTVEGGDELVVFASGKNRIAAGAELHTNFSLAAEGEYLALIASDGLTILSEFGPQYPRQLADVSYGVLTQSESTPLLLSGDALKVVVPANASAGMDWTGVYYDDAGWISGTGGVGFDVDPIAPRTPGFSVRMMNVAGGISTIAVAKSLLGDELPGGFTLQQDVTVDYPAVNHGTSGSYTPSQFLPNGLSADDQYVLVATADVFIPQGTWTIDAATDDGVELTMPGVVFIDPATGASLGTDTISFPGTRGYGHTSGTITVGPGGLSTTITMIMFENGGGEAAELTVAPGQQVFNVASFVLLGDNVPAGWAVKTTSSRPAPSYQSLIGTGIEEQMLGRNASAYIRMPLRFVENPADFDLLRLRVRYDDGFVAYLNGQEIARRNAPASAAWNSPATAEHPDALGVVFEEIDIELPEGLLKLGEGTNVLAIHGLNTSAGDTDFFIEAEALGIHVLGREERYFDEPTPGAANYATDLAGVIADTTFSHDRGFYWASFDVEISAGMPEAEIRYTVDGSKPTATTGTLYTGPITVSSTTVLRAAAFRPGYIPSNVDTQTYIFINDVIRQPLNPEGFPQPGTTGVHWDYEMDPDVVNDPAYSDAMIAAMTQIPSMSLVTDQSNLFGSTGIYQNPGGTGVAWERPTSAELIHPDGKQGFQIDAGLRIYGGVNRSTNFPKHSFRLLFKDEYGAGKLKYPLFEDSLYGDTAVEEFDTLVLRGAFNKSWPFWNEGERTKAQYIHDAFGYITQLAMGQPAIHGLYVHLYIDGLYWGLYNIVERPSAAYGEAYFGGDKEDYDALNSSEAVDGTKAAWTTLQNIVTAGVTTPEQYDQVLRYLDVDNLIDYMIMNFYGANLDWDDHNWYAMRKREDGSGYIFFSWDAERMLEGINDDKTEVGQADKPSFLYKQLRTHPEFRIRFADRVQKHLFNGGALTPDAAAARYWSLANQIDDAIIAESARWGDFQRAQPYTRDVEWLAEQNRLVTQYFPARTNVVINQFRTDGLYPATAAPVLSQHGGSVPLGFSLGITNPNGAGVIYYTLDGSDPRVMGGEISASAQAYAGPIPINGTTTLKARIWDEGQWSALVDVVFHHDLSALAVVEMMYDPPEEAGGTYAAEEFEFIELQNIGASAIDLTGVAFTNGITYSFAGGTTLGAQERLVLVKNLAAFALRYPGVAVHGVYGGSLKNDGERVALGGPGGDFLDFRYKDWDELSAGGGFTLVVVDPRGDLSDKNNWRPSNGRLGTPGAADPGYAAGSVVISEAMTYTADAGGDWIELHNTTGEPIEIGGWFLSDSKQDLRKYRIAAGTIVPAGGFIVFTEAEHFGNAADPGAAVPFAIDRAGDELYLTSNDGAEAGGYREHVDFGAAAAEVSFGRHVKSTGGVDFTAMSAPTRGSANALPSGGPVIISEVMYNSAADGHEFVEIRNLSGAPVALHALGDPATTWRFIEGIEYAFPAGTQLPAFGYALVVPIDPNLFRATHGIADDVLVFGPWEGQLDNAGENLKLARPGDLGPSGGVPWITVEQVHYSDNSPWPAEPDGGGPSLARLSASAYSNDANNWVAGPPGGTPGEILPYPTAPSELTATVTDAGVVTLHWLDRSHNESGFEIERSADGAQFTRIATLAGGAVSFTDGSTLTGGAFYTYRVRAVNVAASSAWSNTFSIRIPQQQVVTLVAANDTWSYNQARTAVDSTWIDPGYDDAAAPWLSGAGPLGNDSNLPGTFKTTLNLGPSGDRTTAYYFRRTFNVSIDPSLISALTLRLFLDDGAVVYLNGNPTPVFAIGMPAAPHAYTTLASRSVGDAVWEGPFSIPISSLLTGQNTIAVEVHQINKTSSDIAFGLELLATLVVPPLAASIIDVTPDPRTGPVDSIDITFGEPVTGLDLSDLQLSRSGGTNLLTAAQTLASADGITWRLGNLAGLTAIAGGYDLKLRASASAIAGTQTGHTLGADVIEHFNVTMMQLAGTAGVDEYRLSINGADVEIHATGQPGWHIPLNEIEALTITGGDGDDRIEISGILPFPVTIDAGAGRDTLVFGGGVHSIAQTLAAAGVEELGVSGRAVLTLAASQDLSLLLLSGESRVNLAAGAESVLRLGALGMADSAVLDLGDGRLVVEAAPAESGSALADITGWIASARITSTGAPGADGILGVARNDDGSGSLLWPAEPAGAVVVLRTHEGDLNLDGRLDGDDYFRFDRGFLAGWSGYQWGDVNYDGGTDGGDAFRLDRAYLIQQGQVVGQALAGAAAVGAAPASSPFGQSPIRDSAVLLLLASDIDLY